MSLLTGSNLARSYGPRDVFSDLTFSIPHRARIGLVGANGIGKTTLLRLLVGLEEPSEGVIHKARGVRIGYLPQEAVFESSQILWDECIAAFSNLVALQSEMAQLEFDMKDPQLTEEALEIYGRRQLEFDQRGGYTFENTARLMLRGLGFSPEDERRPMTQLSGGQRTRAFLARLLLSNPDILIMDEPTNHLDVDATEWLEGYLRDWDGAAVIVSHDRYFLNQVVDTIWEMTPDLEIYHGNYSAYLAQRSERYSRKLEEFQARQEYIEKEEEYIRRNIAGQNTNQAQGRRKRLVRMLDEVNQAPVLDKRPMRLKLDPSVRSGDLIIQARDLSVGYEDEGRPLFTIPELTLVRTECAAVIGPNGAGKTTFLKTLLGQIPPLKGRADLGPSVRVGYFAQAYDNQQPEKTLMEVVETAAPQMRPAEIRSFLARFLFSKDDVFKQVLVLSGGERARLALALLALTGANFLLLDEPTNHLDLSSQEVLQSVLAEYGGTILLVSHDRYLIDALATQIWEVLPIEQSLRIFKGTYSEYKVQKLAESSRITEIPIDQLKNWESTDLVQAAGLSKNEQYRRKQRIAAKEAEIAAIEQKLSVITRQIENPATNPTQFHKLGQEYSNLDSALRQALEEWEHMH